jgi:alcohol dehydrogenase class IV
MDAFKYPVETIITFQSVPTKFGLGASLELSYELKKRDAKKILLFIDKNLEENNSYVKDILHDLAKNNIKYDTYNNIHIEPTDKFFIKAVNDTKSNNYDLYVAIGGGSTIDTAKVVSLMHTHSGDLFDYTNKPIGRAITLKGPIKPVIAIPTTAGTGAESTPTAVFDVVDLKVKTGISYQEIRPACALIDPLLTISMNKYVTASTGMDVAIHALESYTNKPYNARPKIQDPADRPAYIGCNIISDMWCEKAIEIVGKYLRRAYSNPNDLEARWHMMAASSFAGIGFGNAGLHIPHSMAYPIAGLVKNYKPKGYNVEEAMVPHGISVCLTAPAAFKLTAKVYPEKHIKAAMLLGENVDGLNLYEAALKLSDAVKKLMKDIEIPNGLSALGYTKEDIPSIVDGTLKQTRLLVGTPFEISKEILSFVAEESLMLC